MKILILLSRVPYPLEKGDKLRAFHQLRILSRKHEIHLFCLNDTTIHPDALDKLKLYCKSIHIHELSRAGIFWNLVKALFSGLPFQVGYFTNKKAKRAFISLVNELRPDHVYCQLVRTAEYAKNIPLPKTLDYQDVFSKGMERRATQSKGILRWFFATEAKRMARYEEAVFPWFDQKTIISEPDRDLIPHSFRDQIHIISNGVNHDYFVPQTITPVYDLLFTGNMGYPPNIDGVLFLAEEILPLIHRTRPETSLLIAGTNPHPKIKALQSEKIHVAGWVRDMRDCYSQARVFVAPMRIGTGLQNKLLEAMSMEMPCVTSTLANSALKAKPGEEVIIGNDAASYAAALLDILQNQDKYRQIGKNGARFVRSNFDWESCTLKLEQLINNTTHKTQQ